MSVSDSGTDGSPHGGGVAAALLLLLTVGLTLAWSSVKLMGNDEFLSFYTDSVATARGVLQVQLHTPISLDPPTYHLLSHLSMKVFGATATALRLPALAGFLLLQLSLFLLVRRLAGYRAGLVAMVLPVCTASFRYAVEGRPYGLLLGLYAAALLCWYAAAISADGKRRRAALVLLAFVITTAITSHYFGVLIAVPVACGELARTLQRKRFDRPMVAALLAGMSAVLLLLPFKRALAPYQRHYYISSVNLRNVSQGYRELFVHYNEWPMVWQRLIAVLLVGAVVLLLAAAVRRYRQRSAAEPAWLWVALIAFAALPFFGYLFGKFVTHTMEVRYVVAALVAFAVTIPLCLERRLASRALFATTMTSLVAFALFVNVFQIRSVRQAGQAELAALTPAAETQQEPHAPIYVQTLSDFFRDSYYVSDPAARARFRWVYDEDAELHWLKHDTNAITASYLKQFTPLQVVPWEEVRRPGTLLLLYGGGWEWVRDDVQSRRMAMQPLGRVYGGDLVRLEDGR